MLLPNRELHHDHPESEKKIWRRALATRELQGSDRYLIHSAHTTKSPHSVDGEIDLVYIDREVLLFLEVKGGDCRYDEMSGDWWVGGSTYRKNPFQQIKDYFYHHLQNVLPSRFGRDFVGRLQLGFGVLFPDASFTAGTLQNFPQEVERETVYTSKDQIKESGLWDYINRLKSYFKSRRNPSLPQVQPLNDQELLELKNHFRNNLQMEVRLCHLARESQEEVKRYTQEQLTSLTSIKHNPRFGAIVNGGPGTGKTVVALDMAEHQAAAGNRVLMLCYNKLLCARLRDLVRRAGRQDQIEVYTAHDFMVSRLREAGHVFPEHYFSDRSIWNGDLPQQFQRRFAEPSQRPWSYDYLIVDEAQDLFSEHIIAALGLILTTDWDGGHFLLLLDATYQRFYGNFERELYEDFKAKHPVYEHPLGLNCRNPKNIVDEASAHTRLPDMPCKLAANEEKVSWNAYVDEEDLKQQVASLLEKLRKEGVSAGSISILCTSNRLKNSLVGVDPATFDLKDETIDRLFKGTSVSTIHSFKGLDNFFIVLVGLRESDFDEGRASLYYVGYTRAKTKVYLFLKNP